MKIHPNKPLEITSKTLNFTGYESWGSKLDTFVSDLEGCCVLTIRKIYARLIS